MNSAHAARRLFAPGAAAAAANVLVTGNGDRFRFVSALNALTVHCDRELTPLGIKVNATAALEFQDPAARMRVWPVSVPLAPSAFRLS